MQRGGKDDASAMNAGLIEIDQLTALWQPGSKNSALTPRLL
jgi:hypothetical protein